MQERLISVLRWSERYTKTDMVYLLGAAWWANSNILISAGFALLLSIAFANLLSSTEYGLYQYLLSLSVLVASLSLTGMNVAVAQATAREYEGVLRVAVRAQLNWAVVPVVLTLGASAYYFLHGNAAVGITLAVIAVVTPLANTFNTYVGFIEGKRDFKTGFQLGLLVTIVSYCSLLLAVVWVRSAVFLVILNLLANGAAMGYAYFRTLSYYMPNDRVDPTSIPYGRHLSVMGGFTTIMSQVDSLLVFHFLGAAELAIYSLATMLPERAGSFFNFISTASMPKFANQPVPYIRHHLLGKILRVAIAGAVAGIIYAVLVPVVFHLVFPKYLASIRFSQAYAPVIALLAVTSVTNATLFAKRFTREIYILGFVQPILLVALQIPLLLWYGIAGMIAARLSSDVVGICLGIWFFYRPFAASRNTADEVSIS